MNASTFTSDRKVCPECGKSEFDTLQVQKLHQRIEALEAENAILIASATAFADLADRLNKRLRQETHNGR